MLWLRVTSALAGETVELSLEDAVRAAWDNAAERRVAVRRVEEASAVRGFEVDDPQVRLSASDFTSNTDPTGYRVRIRQDVDTLATGMADVRVARAETAVEQAELNFLREEIRAATVESFDRVRLVEAETVLLEAELELLEEREVLVGRRLQADLAGRSDQLDAILDVEKARRRLAMAEHDCVVAQTELLGLIGSSVPDELRLTGPDLWATLQAPLSGTSPSLSVRVGDAEVLAAAAERKAARAAKVPFLDWVQADVGLEQGKTAEWGVAFAFQLPVFSLVDRTVEVANRALAMREAERDLLQSESDLERSLAIARLESAKTTLMAMRSGLDRVSVLLEDRASEMTPDEVLDHRAKLLSERRQQLDVLEEGIRARRVLEGSAG